MGAKIRKLTLSYPFSTKDKQGELRQQRTVFSVDETNNVSMKAHTIEETFDQYHQKMKYLICVEKDGAIKQWKELIPEGATIEIEYFVS